MLFRSSHAARKGDNDIVIEVANTLACKVRDRFSQYIQIPPSGLLGPLTLYRPAPPLPERCPKDKP